MLLHTHFAQAEVDERLRRAEARRQGTEFRRAARAARRAEALRQGPTVAQVPSYGELIRAALAGRAVRRR
jgi:hypothetical protein